MLTCNLVEQSSVIDAVLWIEAIHHLLNPGYLRGGLPIVVRLCDTIFLNVHRCDDISVRIVDCFPLPRVVEIFMHQPGYPIHLNQLSNVFFFHEARLRNLKLAIPVAAELTETISAHTAL